MNSGIPRQHPILREWYDMVQVMLDELLAWMGKKNKHYQTGYPLAARLMCISIQQPHYELTRFNAFIEKLHRLMRDTIFSEAVRQQPHLILSAESMSTCMCINAMNLRIAHATHRFLCSALVLFQVECYGLSSGKVLKSIPCCAGQPLDWVGVLGTMCAKLCAEP